MSLVKNSGGSKYHIWVCPFCRCVKNMRRGQIFPKKISNPVRLSTFDVPMATNFDVCYVNGEYKNDVYSKRKKVFRNRLFSFSSNLNSVQHKKNLPFTVNKNIPTFWYKWLKKAKCWSWIFFRSSFAVNILFHTSNVYFYAKRNSALAARWGGLKIIKRYVKTGLV